MNNKEIAANSGTEAINSVTKPTSTAQADSSQNNTNAGKTVADKAKANDGGDKQDIPHGFSFRPVSFGILAAPNFIFQSTGPNGAYYNFNLATVGAFVNFPLSEKFSIQTGLTYTEMVGKALLRQDTAFTSNDARGPIAQITQTSTYNVNYLQLPVMFKYKFSKRWCLLAGVQVSFATGIVAIKSTADHRRDSFHIVHATLDSSYKNVQLKDIPEINRVSLEVPVGIQWAVSPSLDLSLMYFKGITTVLKSQYHYYQTYGNTNDYLQLRLSYKLFHKKFGGE